MKSEGIFLGGILVLIILFFLWQNTKTTSDSTDSIIIPEVLENNESTWDSVPEYDINNIGGNPSTWGPLPHHGGHHGRHHGGHPGGHHGGHPGGHHGGHHGGHPGGHHGGHPGGHHGGHPGGHHGGHH